MIINEFDINTVKPDALYLIIGSNLSGKTTIIHDIIHANRYLFGTTGTYITSTYEKQKHIIESDIGNDKIIYLNNESTYLDTIKTEIYNSLTSISSSHISIDCLLKSQSWIYDSSFKDLFHYGNINKTMRILAFDNVPKIPNDNKSQIDYIFISNGLEFEEINNIYDIYIKKLSFSEFLSLYSLLEPYDFIVIEISFNKIKYYVYNSENHTSTTNDELNYEEEILNGKIKISIII